MPSCVLKIDKDRNIKKWFDVPRNEYTGEARAMGIEFGPRRRPLSGGQRGLTEEPHGVHRAYPPPAAQRRGRGEVHRGGRQHGAPQRHPHLGDYMYVTQSCMTRQKTDSGKLMSCVYRFPWTPRASTAPTPLADPHIFLTFITENPKCQYGVDGIVFDHDGNLYVGNFGDGVVHKITFNPTAR